MKNEGREDWEDPNALHESEAGAFLSLVSPPSSLEDVEAFDRTAPTKKRVRRVARVEKSLAEYVEEFLAQARLERGAVSVPYERDLRQYIAWLQGKGVRAPREIGSEIVRQFAHDLRAGQLRSARDTKIYAPATINAKLLAVRAWHKFLAREYKMPDPTVRVAEMRQAPMREARAHLRAQFKKAHPRA